MIGVIGLIYNIEKYSFNVVLLNVGEISKNTCYLTLDRRVLDRKNRYHDIEEGYLCNLDFDPKMFTVLKFAIVQKHSTIQWRYILSRLELCVKPPEKLAYWINKYRSVNGSKPNIGHYCVNAKDEVAH